VDELQRDERADEGDTDHTRDQEPSLPSTSTPCPGRHGEMVSRDGDPGPEPRRSPYVEALASDLFSAAVEERLSRRAPLAARLRPRTLDEVVGQEQLLGRDKPLRALIEADRLSSVVLWGPPGTGKTTVARLVAGATQKAFEPMSAVTAGVKDVREVVERARARLGEHGQGTILFLDE